MSNTTTTDRPLTGSELRAVTDEYRSPKVMLGILAAAGIFSVAVISVAAASKAPASAENVLSTTVTSTPEQATSAYAENLTCVDGHVVADLQLSYNGAAEIVSNVASTTTCENLGSLVLPNTLTFVGGDKYPVKH